MRIEVAQVSGPVCVDPADGGRLGEVVTQTLERGESVLLDFTGVTILTSSFLNAAIGFLFGTFSAEDLARRLQWCGLDSTDESLIRLVQSNAIRYFSATESQRERLAESGMLPFHNA